MPFAAYLWVMLGGALGTGARFALARAASERWGDLFPWGTIFINITGSFLIGLFAGLHAEPGRWLTSSTARQFFVVGICGGYTTFSSFSLQTLVLARDGHRWLAAANVVGSVVLCLGAVWLGAAAATQLNRPG